MRKLITIFAALCLFGPAIASAREKDELQRAAATIERLNRIPERGIPSAILRNARGLAIVRVYKAGLGFSGRVGNGVVVARTARGWSGPTFISTAGAGFGPQVGVNATDFVFVLNSQRAVDAFSRAGNITLGGDLSVAVGPIGRTAELGVTPVAAVYTYSQSRGLFVGASLEGAILVTRPGANYAFYGRQVTPSQILSGRVRAPRGAAPLVAALEWPRRMGPSRYGYAQR